MLRSLPSLTSCHPFNTPPLTGLMATFTLTKETLIGRGVDEELADVIVAAHFEALEAALKAKEDEIR